MISIIDKEAVLKIDSGKPALYEKHLQNVTEHILCEFLGYNKGCIDFSPQLSSCENRLKEIFLRGLETTQKFSKIKLDEVARSWHPFNFESLASDIDVSIKLTDEFLSEAFLSLIGVQFFMNNFDHLISFSDKKYLEDEINLLEKDNNFEPLRDEIERLKIDEKYIRQLSNAIYIGLFKVDIEDIKKMIQGRIEKAIRECIESTIITKFQKLLEENKERFERIAMNLNESIDTVESFIEMKTLLNSQDLTESIENIQSDIKLCRNINDFLERQYINTEVLLFEYMNSLSWVKELRKMQSDARKKLTETGPKFVLELNRETISIMDELVQVQKETKKFELNADLIKANTYYGQVLELSKQLNELQERGDNVNKKQSILECSESNFEPIGAEIKSFEKFFSWWEFIAARWSPSVELWWKGNFHEIKTYEMQRLIINGSDLLKRLSDEFSGPIESPLLEIIKQKQKEVEHHQNIFNHISILKDPCFKERHWASFFHEIREQDKGSVGIQQGKLDYKRITLQELMDFHLLSHTNFLKQILIKARSEAVIEQSIKQIKENIKKIQIKPRTFDNDNTGLQIIPNISSLISLLYEYLSKLESMMGNPEFPVEFKLELKSLEKLVRYTIDVFQHVFKIQSQLMQYSPVFRYHSLIKYVSQDSLQKFKNLRQDFQDIMKNIFQKEMNFFVNLLGSKDESSASDDLVKKLIELKTSCDDIYGMLKHFFKLVRVECPRYYFFSDEQMAMLCSLLKFPKSLLGLIGNLFKDISSIDIEVINDGSEVDRVILRSLTTKSGEVASFDEPKTIDLSSHAELPMISILKTIESAVHEYFLNSRVDHLLRIAKCNFNFADVFRYAISRGIIFQNIRLYIQMIFDYELISIFKSSTDPHSRINVFECLVNLKKILEASFTEFFDHPYRFIGEQYSSKVRIYYFDCFLMLIRHLESTLDHLIRKETIEFSSFDFQVLPKYGVEFPRDLLGEGLGHKLMSVESITAEIFQHTNTLQADCYRREQLSAATSPVFERLYCGRESRVVFTTLGYSLEHKSELSSGTYPMVYTPLYEKGLFGMVSAILNCKLVLLNGANDIGKNNQIRSLSQLVGVPLFESDCSLNQNIYQVPSYFAGLLSGGFWVNFKGIESCSNHLLSVISTQVEIMKAAVSGTFVTLQEGFTVKPVPGHCVFATCRVPLSFNQQSARNLPISLIEHFRIITLSTPPLSQLAIALVAPCLGYEEAKNWANRLILFVKMNGKIDFDVDQTADDHGQLKQKLFGGSLGIQLKTLCKLIRISLERFYLHVGSLYEKHRDPATGQFRFPIEKFQAINKKMRRAVFTRLFIEAITEHFHQAEVSSFKVKGIRDLLSEIFKEEIEPATSHEKKAFMPLPDKKLKEKIMESIKEYKEINPNLNIPPAAKLLPRVEGFVKTLYNSRHHSLGHFMVYGNPDSQKSTLIKLMSFIYSELHKINFRKYWLNLEALNREHVFGTEEFEGLLKEIFYQSHSLDLEDKTNQPKKINYLFQSNCELFYELADVRDPKKAKNKEVQRDQSWLIFDANTGKNSPSTSETIGKIASLFDILHSPNEINQYIGFSSDLKVFYELNTVAMLEPKVLTQMKLFYLEEPLVNLQERLSIWLDSLKPKDIFFRATSDQVETMIEELVIPFIQKLTQKNSSDKSDSLFILTKSLLSMLNSFLEVFEIFWNEFRKYHTVHEFEELKTQPGIIATAKAELANTSKNSMSAWRQPAAFNTHMMLAEQAQSTTMVQARARISPSNTNVSALANNYLTGIDKVEDILEMEARRIEGITIFSMIYSMYSLIFESRRSSANKILDEVIHSYTKKMKVLKPSFACGFVNISDQRKFSSLTDYCFDISKGAWVKWVDVKIRSQNDISSSFTKVTFSRVEMERIGCQNQKMFNQPDLMAEGISTPENFVGLKERSLVATPEYCMVNYFVEHLVSYGKHLTIVSEHQQGKSLMIGTILRRIIEQNKIVTMNFDLQRTSNPDIIQRHIENNLLKDNGNVRRPPNKKTAVVWLDDVQMSVGKSNPESLLRCLQVQGGWFSYSSKNFFKLLQTIFLLSMSIRESEIMAAKETMASINVDILSKAPMLKLRKINQEEFKSIFLETVVSNIASTPTSSKKAEEGLTSSLFKQFINVIYANLEPIRLKSNYRSIALTLDNFYQVAKSFNCINWKDTNRDKKNVQFVVYFLLHELSMSDLGLLSSDYRLLLAKQKEQKADMRVTSSEAFPQGSVRLTKSKPLEEGKQMGRERRKSASNFDIHALVKPSSQEEESGKRGRSGSMHMDDKSEVSSKKSSPSKSGFYKETKSSRHISDYSKETKSKKKFSPFKNYKKEDPEPEPNSNDTILKDRSESSGEEKKAEQESGNSGSHESSSRRASSSKTDGKSVQPEPQPTVPAKMSRFFNPSAQQQPPKISVAAASERESNSNSKSRNNSPVRANAKRGRRNSKAMSSYSVAMSQKPMTVAEVQNEKQSSDSETSSDESAEYLLQNPSILSPFLIKKALAKKLKGNLTAQDESNAPSILGSDLPNRDKIIKIPTGSIAYGIDSDLSGSSKSDKLSLPRVTSKLVISEDSIVKYMDTLLTSIVMKDKQKKTQYEKIKSDVLLKNKLLFDYAIQEVEDKDEMEKDYDLFQCSFEILDPKKSQRLVKYIKQSLETYLFQNPEATLAFMLDKANFPRFLNDFNSMHLSLMNEFQHLVVNSLKSNAYVKHLLAFICECMGEGFKYFDLTLDDSVERNPTEVTQDTYRLIKDCIKDYFEKIIKNNRRLVIMINVGSLSRKSTRGLLNKIMDLVGAIVFNTDMMLDHFVEHINDFTNQIKKHRLWSHYEDFFCSYIIRNKLESKVTFVIVHEYDQEELYQKKLRLKSPEESNIFTRFLSQNFPKFASRAKRLVINGLRCGLDLETDGYYENILPFNPYQQSTTFHACVTLEMAYLKQLDKDINYFCIVRPHHENLVFFNHLKDSLRRRFLSKTGESANDTAIKEQNQLINMIERRREYSVKESKAKSDEIELKKLHMQEISANTSEMDTLYATTKEKKQNYFKFKIQLDKELDAIRLEEENFKKIMKDLEETEDTIISIKDKELHTTLTQGLFLSSNTFKLYAVLYYEVFRSSSLPSLSLGELDMLNMRSSSSAQYSIYAKSLAATLADIVAFKAIIKAMKEKSTNVEIAADRLQILYKIVSNTENTYFNNFQADQQLFMLWIDLLVESRVLIHSKVDRETNSAIINADLRRLQGHIDECDKAIEGFEHLMKERQKFRAKLEDDIQKLTLAKEEKEKTIIALEKFKSELTMVQTMYLRTTSPFIAYNLDKETTIELLASFILFWNKYPYQVKRTLFFNLLKYLNMNTEIFNEIQLYDFISTEPPLLQAFNSKIPFNLSMLNNVAILQFLQDGIFPFCIVKDPSGLLVRYMEQKYTRHLHTDYCIPSDNTIQEIEKCLEHGQPYLAIDPNEELLRIIKPLIEWRYKRCSEHILFQADMPVNPTYNVVFRTKNIIVKEGFRLIIVLQKNRAETVDPVLLSQCIFVNNDFGEKKIWNETLTEELIIFLENPLRNEYVQEFIKSNLQSKIYERYNQLNKMLSEFEFMHGALEGPEFKKIQILLNEVEGLALQQEIKIKEKRENFRKAKQSADALASETEELDQQAYNFMNNHYAISIPGYYKLYNKYMNLSDRLRVYQAANEKFKAYVGDQLAINQELFMYMFKECILGYKKELDDVISAENTMRTENILQELNENLENQGSPKKEFSSESLDQIFSKIEKSFFNQIVNSIPNSCRYIYNFLCGLTQILSHAGSQKKIILKNVYLFLYSEKLLSRQDGDTAFVNRNLYDKFNKLLRILDKHFMYSSSNIPANLELHADMQRKMTAVSYLEDVKSTLKLELLTEGGGQHKQDRGSVLALGALVTGDISMNFQASKGNLSQADQSGNKSSILLKGESSSSHDEKIEDKITKVLARQETMKDVSKELGKSLDTSKVESNPGTQGQSSRIIQPLGSATTKPKLQRMTSMELFVDSYGNFVNNIDQIRNPQSTPQSKPQTLVDTGPKRLTILKPINVSLQIDERDSEDQSPKRTAYHEGFGSAASGLISPTKSKKSLQTLISATKSIIEKNKIARANFQAQFLENVILYLGKLMTAITKVDRHSLMTDSMKEWQDFMNFGRSALLSDSSRSVFPKTPLHSKTVAELGQINVMNFFKYTRPDLLKFLLESFYAELRGQSYLRYHLDLGRFVKLEAFSKPIVLVYGHTYRSPFASLQRIADSMDVQIHAKRLEVNYRLDSLTRLLDACSSKNVWLVLENIELLSNTAAFSLMRAIANFMKKQQHGTKFKIWILYYFPNSSASDLVIHQNWPEWINFCYRIHLDLNKSIKEEMISLYWGNIYQLSAIKSEQPQAETNKKRAILLRAPSILVSMKDLNVLMPEVPSIKTIKEDSDHVNLLSALIGTAAKCKTTIDFSKKYKAKLVYCLKFMWSVCRQRSLHLSKILGRECVFSAITKSDAEVDFILEGSVCITRNAHRSHGPVRGAATLCLPVPVPDRVFGQERERLVLLETRSQDLY